MKTKVPLLLFSLLFSLTLFGQITPLDSLAQLPLSASAKEKVGLMLSLEEQFRSIKEESNKETFVDQFFEIATTRKDSIFLELAHWLKGEDEIHSNISRKYGLHLEHLPSEKRIYSHLNIYHDKKGNSTFEEIRNNDQLFGSNNTLEEEYNYDPREVYWAKLVLYGNSEMTDDYLLLFSPDRWFTSWEKIDSWMVHANDSTSYFQTGDQFANPSRFSRREAEKPIPSPFNMLRYTIQQNEKVVLYFRLEGVDEEKIAQPDHIRLFLLEEDKWPGLFPGYPFKGNYLFDNQTLLFASNPIINHEFHIDKSRVATIDDIANKQEILDWKDASKTRIKEDEVYWIRARFYGSPYFNGEQILHLSPWAGRDEFSFDFVDSYVADGHGNYIHQRTGDNVPLRKRGFEHWVNFIKLEIGERDTVDLFIRLEGADPRFLPPTELGLYHVDPYSLFPSQSNFAVENGIFFGILAIQCIFFFLLFLIEKEPLHVYFSIFILGIILVLGTQGLNYISYVPFPTFRDFHIELFSLGIFSVSVGFLKFVEKYFNYSKTSSYAKWQVPIFIFLAAVICLNYIFQFRIVDDENTYYTNSFSHRAILIVLLLMSLIIGIAVYKAPRQKNVSKSFFTLAFAPVLLVGVLFLFTELFLPILEIDNNTLNHILPNAVKIAMIMLLILLALSIGSRTNRLKAEKASALQKNLDDQKRVNKAVSRFVPNEFLSALGKSDITEIKLGDTIQKEVTVFFSDIRNFTSISEELTPQENFRFVNAYNSRMGPIIQNYKGFINQYLGDGIMAIFPNSVDDALRSAIEMQQAIQQYNSERALEAKSQIKVGMGLHSGPLIMGITGDENRMDATTISDSVNSASRIENLTKHYGASILLSEVSLKKLDDPTSFLLRYLGEVQVKGKLKPLKIYECFDGDLPELKANKLKALADFEKGINYYFEKHFAKAALAFKNVVEQNSKDRTAKLFLNKARTLDASGVTEDWTGVEMMLEK